MASKLWEGRGVREGVTVSTHQAEEIASKIAVPYQHDDDALRCGVYNVSMALIGFPPTHLTN